MVLNEKYSLIEDSYNLSLYENKFQKDKKTGEMKPVKSLVGHYPPTAKGRVFVYHKIINLGISELEEQSLENILKVIEDTNYDIKYFLSDQNIKVCNG